jgi:3-methyladenine DNA glycosylase AlkC
MNEKEFAKAVAQSVRDTVFMIDKYVKEDKKLLDRFSFENTVENIKLKDKAKGNELTKAMQKPLFITDKFITDVYVNWFNEKYGGIYDK